MPPRDLPTQRKMQRVLTQRHIAKSAERDAEYYRPVEPPAPRTPRPASGKAADVAAIFGGGLDFTVDDFAQANVLTRATSSRLGSGVAAPSEGPAAVLNSLLREYAVEAFADVADIRRYITNKLLIISSCGNIKHELKALELLGKHGDVRLFTESEERAPAPNDVGMLVARIRERVRDIAKGTGLDTADAVITDLDAELSAAPPVAPVVSPATPDNSVETTATPEVLGRRASW